MALPTLVIRIAADDEIRRHGQEAYPNESCGALLGRGRVVTDAMPCTFTSALAILSITRKSAGLRRS